MAPSALLQRDKRQEDELFRVMITSHVLLYTCCGSVATYSVLLHIESDRRKRPRQERNTLFCNFVLELPVPSPLYQLGFRLVFMPWATVGRVLRPYAMSAALESSPARHGRGPLMRLSDQPQRQQRGRDQRQRPLTGCSAKKRRKVEGRWWQGESHRQEVGVIS